jgi:hypothetical protein
MIKILILLVSFFMSINFLQAEEMDCSQFDKLSAKYVECSALQLKQKSKDLKNTTVKKIDESKKKFEGSELKENLIKFKNSKTLTKFMEKN